MTRSAVGVAACLVAVALAMCTFERWLGRRARHDLAWTVALVMFAIAAGALAGGAGVGWGGAGFRVFYLFGAVLNVPFLALGTVYLLGGAALGDRVAVALLGASGFATGAIVSAPFTHPLPVERLAQGSQVFGVLPRVLAGVGSGVGAVVVLGGALWSAWRARRSRAAALAWGNVLIAAGILVTGGSGLLNSVFDAMTAFSVTLLVGISLLFAGFVLATTDRPTADRPTADRPTADRPTADRPLPTPPHV